MFRFENYSDEQKVCIKTINENLQIIACAGSGKTRTIVGRSIYIIKESFANPSEMVAITFTKKAAEELKERIYNLYEDTFDSTEGLAEMYTGTIHGFCLEFLQTSIPEYKKYEVLNDIQKKLLAKKFMVKEIINSVPYYKKDNNVGDIHSYKLKDISILLDTISFINEELVDISTLSLEVQDLYRGYEELLREKKYFDFSSVQKCFYDELNSNEKLQDKIKKLKYITVDEYQDTNVIQEAILLKMVEINPNLNICVVGDDDQTLYSWRESNIKLFSQFDSTFKNVRRTMLTKNYRSSMGIVNIGERVASGIKDINRITKQFDCNETYTYEPGDITIHTDFNNIDTESDAIIASINKLYGSIMNDVAGNKVVIDYNHMAILVDSTKNLRKFNPYLLEQLDKSNIDYIIDGTNQLFDTIEIRNVTDIMVYFATTYCGLSFNGYINYFNDDFVEKTVSRSKKLKIVFDRYNKKVDDKFEVTIQQLFLDIISTYKLSNFEKSKQEKILYNFAVYSEIITDFEKIYFLDRYSHRIKEFIRYIKYDAQDLYPEGWLSPKFSDIKCLKIMTIYNSKGLEFPVVFLPHICKRFLFPSQAGSGASKEGILRNNTNAMSIMQRYKKNEADYSRLFYVAVTRSMKYLIITKALEYSKGKKTTYRKKPIQLNHAETTSYRNNNVNTLLNKKLQYDDVVSSENEKLVFDFSTLKDIFECPRKFKFSTIYGFSSPLNVRMGFGKSLHNMLDELHTTYLETKLIIPFKDLEKHIHLPLAPPEGDLMKSVKKSSNEIIVEYTKMNSSQFDSIQYVESPIDYKLNDLIFINGRVDLIENPKSGDIEIIDFKSDSNTLTPDVRKQQLMIYAMGYKKLTGKDATSVVSYDLKSNERHVSNVSIQDLEQVESEINKAYNMIKTNKYPKNAVSGICDKCIYSELCDKQS